MFQRVPETHKINELKKKSKTAVGIMHFDVNRCEHLNNGSNRFYFIQETILFFGEKVSSSDFKVILPVANPEMAADVYFVIIDSKRIISGCESAVNSASMALVLDDPKIQCISRNANTVGQSHVSSPS
ncbi:hypothetical protein AB6A40_006992 [Gnathostoma spinigerum]|uniref:Uncharacterized protein n=1 Tax=Gnathostoma spinigerum TaxID=75299 RepID=A0ABD6EK71_9BILA